MADTIDVSCPDCNKKLKVPARFAGKRVKCTGCGTPVSVAAASPVAAAAKPVPTEESGARPAEAPAATKENARVTWDDEADSDNAPMSVVHEEIAPRCPHCAQLLIPPDAIVCVHCGFNSRTRMRAETKKVYEPEPAEWFAHLAPGVLCVIAIVVLLVLDVLCLMDMRYWMEGGMLESDEEGFDGRKKMYISPGLFISMAFFASIFAIIPLSRIGYRRLFKDYMPPEEKIEEKNK